MYKEVLRFTVKGERLKSEIKVRLDKDDYDAGIYCKIVGYDCLTFETLKKDTTPVIEDSKTYEVILRVIEDEASCGS